jgi:hypothetical protein
MTVRRRQSIALQRINWACPCEVAHTGWDRPGCREAITATLSPRAELEEDGYGNSDQARDRAANAGCGRVDANDCHVGGARPDDQVGGANRPGGNDLSTRMPER